MRPLLLWACFFEKERIFHRQKYFQKGGEPMRAKPKIQWCDSTVNPTQQDPYALDFQVDYVSVK
jgi:hypothetical protein